MMKNIYLGNFIIEKKEEKEKESKKIKGRETLR